LKERYYTFHILASDKEKPTVFTLSSATAKSIVIVTTILLVGIITAFVFLIPKARDYNRVSVENEELLQDRLTVMRILSDYNQIRQMDKYIRSVLGTDLNLPPLDSIELNSLSLPMGINSNLREEFIEISYLDNIPIYPPVEGYITQGFVDDHIFEEDNHYGIDIAALGDEPIRAAASGVVIFSNWTYYLGYTVILYHGEGYLTIYGHNRRNTVEAHQYVRRGDVIGFVGDTGISEGPHLHFEIWREGSPIDPQDMIYSYRGADISIKKIGE
jgi:murein DD-endopeptidase MepM/ murein hydrolase activator NlpD